MELGPVSLSSSENSKRISTFIHTLTSLFKQNIYILITAEGMEHDNGKNQYWFTFKPLQVEHPVFCDQ